MSLNRWQRTLIFPATFYRLQPSIAAMAKVPNCSLDGIFLPTSVAPGLSLQIMHLPGPDPDDTTLLRFIHVSSFPLFPDWLCVCVSRRRQERCARPRSTQHPRSMSCQLWAPRVPQHPHLHRRGPTHVFHAWTLLSMAAPESSSRAPPRIEPRLRACHP